jgi:hypothetical protein
MHAQGSLRVHPPFAFASVTVFLHIGANFDVVGLAFRN